VARYNSADDDNFTQVATYWTRVLNADERLRLVQNIAGHLANAQEFIQERVIKNFSLVHPSFGKGIEEELRKKGRKSLPHYETTAGSTHYHHSSNL